MINQWQGYKTGENDVSLSWFTMIREMQNKIMPSFEQNWGTNLKMKSASRLETEIWNSEQW